MKQEEVFRTVSPRAGIRRDPGGGVLLVLGRQEGPPKAQLPTLVWEITGDFGSGA